MDRHAAWATRRAATVSAVPRARSRQVRARTWGQRLLLAFGTFLSVTCVTAAAGFVYLQRQFQDIQRIAFEPGVLSSATEGLEARNILLVGIDRAEGLDPDDPVRNDRNMESLLTDTMIILRIDPAEERAALLSIPRDLWVDIAGAGYKSRINSAMAIGGPDTLIETIKQEMGIPIHNFVQVDFVGFQRMVEAIGGVPIYFEHPARDRNSGLAVYEPGCINLDSNQALAYVRSRHYQFDDGSGWRSDGRNDYGRTERQQHFLQKALKRAVNRGLRNPVTMNELISVGQGNVELDDRLSTGDIYDIGMQFRSFNPDSLEQYSLPTSEGTVGIAQVLFLREDEAQSTLEVFRGTAGTLTFERIRVRVENGSGASGQAGEVGAALGQIGYTVTGTANAADLDTAGTTIRYAPGNEVAAVYLARFLPVEVDFVADDSISGADVVLVTGKDFTSVLDEPQAEEPFLEILEGLKEANGSTSTSSTSVPGTTAPEVTVTTIDPAVAAEMAACG